MQFKIKVYVLACITLGIIFVGLSACHAISGETTGKSNTHALMSAVKPETLKALFPETVGHGKPVIVDIYTKFCLDCQHLKPKLNRLVQQHSQLTLLSIDIQHPVGQQKAVLKTFQVPTVPYVLFISGQGHVVHMVLKDTSQTELNTMAAALVQ